MERRIVKNGTVQFKGGTYCHQELLLFEGEKVLIEPDYQAKDCVSVRTRGLALICTAQKREKFRQLSLFER